MSSADLLAESFGRIRDLTHGVVQDLTADELARRPAPDANSIGWLVWHLTRVQDDHVAKPAGHPQAWDAAWLERMRLPFEVSDIGYGHSSEEVAAVRIPSAQLLVQYHDEVFERTRRYVAVLSDDDLDRVIDRSFDPPVTLAARLVSVVSDDLQHVGQAAYVRGLIG